jgi:uncharacterized protein YgiM (DUF1202 family)
MLAFALMIFTVPSSALITPSTSPVPAKTEKKVVAPFSQMNVEEFLALTPKKYKELTGEKLSFGQKISLKIAQKKIRKALKNNEKIDSATMANAVDTSDFNIGGFVLGLLLNVVGVLIAYLIGDTNVIKWAWIGFAISMAIFLLVWLI